jgi:hypothetical protein
MPERFSAEFGPVHDRIIELIESPAKKVAIAAPRGCGKTSLCIARVAQKVLYRQIHFVPYVGQSQTAALMQTENLKRELITNRDIRRLFGSVKAGGSAFCLVVLVSRSVVFFLVLGGRIFSLLTTLKILKQS